MLDYYRIEKRTFWLWVGVSLGIGLIIGLGLFFWRATTDSRRISNLEIQVERSAREASGTVEDMRAQLTSAQVEVSALQVQNAELTSALASATAAAAAAAAEAEDGKVEITSRSVSPESVTPSGTITLTVKVKGRPDQVRMQIVGTGGITYDKLHYLSKVSTSGDVETWRKTIAAPSAKGVYRYYAGAIRDGKKTVMPGTSGWTFRVK